LEWSFLFQYWYNPSWINQNNAFNHTMSLKESIKNLFFSGLNKSAYQRAKALLWARVFIELQSAP